MIDCDPKPDRMGGAWGLWPQMILDEFPDDLENPEVISLKQEMELVGNEADLVKFLLKHYGQRAQFHDVTEVLEKMRTKAFSLSTEDRPDGQNHRDVYDHITKAYSGFMLVNACRNLGIEIDVENNTGHKNASYKMPTDRGEIEFTIKNDAINKLKSKIKRQNKNSSGARELSLEQKVALEQLKENQGYGIIPVEMGPSEQLKPMLWINMPVTPDYSLEDITNLDQMPKHCQNLVADVMLSNSIAGDFIGRLKSQDGENVAQVLRDDILSKCDEKIIKESLTDDEKLIAAEVQQQIVELLLNASRNQTSFEDCLVELEYFWLPETDGSNLRKRFINGAVSAYIFAKTALVCGFDVRIPNPKSDVKHKTDFLIRRGKSKWVRVDVKSRSVNDRETQLARAFELRAMKKQRNLFKAIIPSIRLKCFAEVFDTLSGLPAYNYLANIRNNILTHLYIDSHAQT